MKKLSFEQMLKLDSAFPGCLYETVVEEDMKLFFVYLRPEVTEKYRNIFEKCALNIKEVGYNEDVTYHKFDVIVKGLGNATLIKIPMTTFDSVTKNLAIYWEGQHATT